MPAVLVKLTLRGTPYGRYPDAHTVLSTIYTHMPTGQNLEGLRVSGLLPIDGEQIYVPAPTTLLGLPPSEDRGIKAILAGIKRGAIFIPADRALQALSPEEAPDMYLRDYYRLRNTARPMNALDRLTGAANLFFEPIWSFEKVAAQKPRRPELYGFIAYTEDDTAASLPWENLQYAPIGANKSHGAVIVDVNVEDLRYGLGTDGGLLLSLALPTSTPPKTYPVVVRRPVVVGTRVQIFGVYGAGSVLRSGEFTGGDQYVGEDRCLFVRPLFLGGG